MYRWNTVRVRIRIRIRVRDRVMVRFRVRVRVCYHRYCRRVGRCRRIVRCCRIVRCRRIVRELITSTPLGDLCYNKACVHGYCNGNTGQCECYKGWTGYQVANLLFL